MEASAVNIMTDEFYTHFVEFQSGAVKKDSSAAIDNSVDKKVESVSSVQKLLIESMLKSINVMLRQQHEDQRLHGQYSLHSGCVVHCAAWNLSLYCVK